MLNVLRQKLATALRRRLGFPDQYLALKRLKSAGFTATEVLDVGASDGSFADELWEFWPQARVHCFEPEPEFVRTLEARNDVRLSICQALVGSSDKKSLQYFHHLGASSVFKESHADSNQPEVRESRVVSLNSYCETNPSKANFLKIDVQGFELEVLRGATSVLPQIDVVLSEVNHLEIYKDAPLAAELIDWIGKQGFALYDVCNLMRRPLDSALWQSDMIFVNKKSPLLSSRNWH